MIDLTNTGGKIMRIGKIISIVALLFSTLLAGCSATGPQYAGPSEVRKDMGVVYIYRPGKFMGAGVVFDVHVGPEADNRAIVGLRSGGYFPYYAAPGELELWAKTESKSSVTVDVVAGEAVYVRGSVGVGLLVGRPSLEVVDPTTGKNEISSCKLLEPAKAK